MERGVQPIKKLQPPSIPGALPGRLDYWLQRDASMLFVRPEVIA
jgi:hypothetical protein